MSKRLLHYVEKDVITQCSFLCWYGILCSMLIYQVNYKGLDLYSTLLWFTLYYSTEPKKQIWRNSSLLSLLRGKLGHSKIYYEIPQFWLIYWNAFLRSLSQFSSPMLFCLFEYLCRYPIFMAIYGCIYGSHLLHELLHPVAWTNIPTANNLLWKINKMIHKLHNFRNHHSDMQGKYVNV